MKITILTVGSRGDVQPYVALGLGLQSAGHDVSLATHACWQSLVRAHGLGYRPVAGDPRSILEGNAGQMWLSSDRSPAGFLRGFMEVAQPLMAKMSDDYWAACQDAGLILYPILAALPAAAIAEKLKVPALPAYLQHVHTTAMYPSAMMPPMPLLGAVYNRLTYSLGGEVFWRAMRPAMNKWRQERLGLPALPRRSQFPAWDRARLPCFYGFSRVVVPRPPEWGDHVHITGYWFVRTPVDSTVAAPGGQGGRADSRLVDFLASGPPPVFVGFGSMTGRDPEQVAGLVVEALARSRRRGLLLTGWGGLRPGDLPDDVLAIDAAPHDWLFPQVAAVVHHGGAGTTAAGLAAGKPSVVVPFFADQHFWAWRVAVLGAGPQPVPRRELTARRLAEAISEATTNPSITGRAAAIGSMIRSEDGVGTVAALLESYSRTAHWGGQ